ncbi:MAG: flagellar assembly protein T N-terminal domain-containing protein [Smithellaceae bacterium]|nr:flagellar assembly protein T N-terminal domain-containing protein [Smithellaceae bacterium]
MRKNLLLIFLLLIGLFHHSAYAVQATTDLTLQVEGRAPVVKNDEARAREEAIKNALEKAITQAAAKILSDKFEDEKFQAVKNIMIDKADRYIKNYRIISENRQHDEYTANVHVAVALALVRDDLLQMGVIQGQKGKEGVSVSLSLKGMKKYSDFADLRTFLQSRPKIVQSVYPCRLEWQQAHFVLALTGEVQNLVTEFEKSGKYSLEVLKRNQNVVEINLQVKEETQ